MSSAAVAAVRSNAAPVVTVLDPTERARVEAAGQGLYRTVHREPLRDVIDDLRHARAAAVVLSVMRTAREGSSVVGRVVREFPAVPTVALVTGDGPSVPAAAMRLGAHRVRTLIDVRDPGGWRQLRDHLTRQQVRDLDARALALLRQDIPEAHADTLAMFARIFDGGTRLATVRDLARGLGVCASTLNSRFFRARLPAPKRYLAWARLVRAAHLLENPGVSLAACALRLEYSSPQSFGRHVRTLLGCSAGEFRARHDGERMLRRYREELVLPHRAALQALGPFRLTASRASAG